jgi:hypothetical protein
MVLVKKPQYKCGRAYIDCLQTLFHVISFCFLVLVILFFVICPNTQLPKDIQETPNPKSHLLSILHLKKIKYPAS